jgi:hypothetical protein
MGLLSSATRAGLEGFVNPDSASMKESSVEFVSILLSFIVALIILSLIGKLLWNSVIVDLFSFARPAKSFWQILGLFVFTSLLL